MKQYICTVENNRGTKTTLRNFNSECYVKENLEEAVSVCHAASISCKEEFENDKRIDNVTFKTISKYEYHVDCTSNRYASLKNSCIFKVEEISPITE